MSYNYKVNELEANRVGMDTKYGQTVQAILALPNGNTCISKESISDLLDKVRKSKIKADGTSVEELINSNNIGESTPGYRWRINETILPTYPLLTANDIDTYNGNTIENTYIYAVKSDEGFKFISNNLNEAENYALIFNKKSDKNNDLLYSELGNVIPFYSVVDSNTYIDIYSSDDSAVTKMINDINCYNESNYCFVAESKNKRSFIFKGAVSLVNITKYLQDVTVKFRYKYNSTNKVELGEFVINKLLLVEPVYTSSTVTTDGW